jgi:hypothetical protein
MVINHAICSEMLVKRGVRQRWPWATTFVVGLTALLTIAQFMYPALLPAMERQTGMWRDHQYWRIVTPLFLHSDGWKQIALNFSGHHLHRSCGRVDLRLPFLAYQLLLFGDCGGTVRLGVAANWRRSISGGGWLTWSVDNFRSASHDCATSEVRRRFHTGWCHCA